MTGLIHYELINQENIHLPWLVMVHGFTQNSKYFSAQIPAFEKQHRLCLIDLRGHGKSMLVPGPFGVEEYANDIFHVLNKEGIDQCCFWGTHTGAAIALIMALRQLERFTHLVLEGTFLPGYHMPRVGELIERAKTIARRQGIPAAREDWFNKADWFDVIRANPQKCRAEEHYHLINEFSGILWLNELRPRPVTNAADHLQELNIPVLLYNGEKDLSDFRHAAEYMSGRLPNVQREIILKAGGFPAWEFPDIVNKLVLNFLRIQ